MPRPEDPHAAARDLIEFIAASPSPFHAVAEATRRLEAAGFTRLGEEDAWEIAPHGRHFVTRNDSSIVALVAGGRPVEEVGYRLIAAHTDSPALKLKPDPVIERHGYIQLGVEVYGGTLHNSWLDRDLGLAGRVVLAEDVKTARRARAGARAALRSASRAPLSPSLSGLPGTESHLFLVEQPIARIPQLAIHLDREVNEKGLILNRENHLVPLIGLSGARAFDFRGWLGEQLGVPAERVLDHDLLLFDVVPPYLFGIRQEFVSAPRLDNLASSYCGLAALLAAAKEKTAATRAIALYDNEEIGSSTRQGADGSLLGDVLSRVGAALGTAPGSAGATPRRAAPEAYARARARSILISADMAHAIHPNYADRNEPRQLPRLNGGPVIKYNANARYATDAASGALFQTVCREAGVPCQKYVNRADLVCGSTLGPIVSRRLGVPTVDVGNPQLSMHGAREMAGAFDPAHMIGAMRRFLLR